MSSESRTSLSFQEIRFADIAVGDVLVDAGWKDSKLWGQTVTEVTVHPVTELDERFGRLFSVRLTGHCGLTTRENTIVGILR